MANKASWLFFISNDPSGTSTLTRESIEEVSKYFSTQLKRLFIRWIYRIYNHTKIGLIEKTMIKLKSQYYEILWSNKFYYYEINWLWISNILRDTQWTSYFQWMKLDGKGNMHETSIDEKKLHKRILLYLHFYWLRLKSFIVYKV